ncbi:MAG: DUF692 domain-containing protein [Micavibrio sp.]|nr:DUF692 domain-containing protein [Micavibrio sp.]
MISPLPYTPFKGPLPALADAPTGIGLRAPHTEDVIAEKPPVGFLEAHSENYFRLGSIPFEQLMTCRESYPVSLHGVGLSLGTAGGVGDEHLRKLAELVDAVAPALVSEHISWSGTPHKAVPDLLPLPMTAEALDTICANISRVQDRLKRYILVENPSSYLAFRGEEMAEPQFIAEIIHRTGCGLLLDINNIHVSAHNIGFDAEAYLDAIPQGIVGEVHLAGYHVNTLEAGDIYIDAHNHPVYDGVWELYKKALQRFGNVPTLVEWDSDLPPLQQLVDEAQKADKLRAALKNTPKDASDAKVA